MTSPALEHASLLRILFVRMRFIFIFLAVGLVVGRWESITDFVDRHTRPAQAHDEVTGEFEYYCPMHPSVVRDLADQKCPICGMPLSRRKKGEKIDLPVDILARLQLSPYRIQQAGVATAPVEYRMLVREIRNVGFIEYDERRLQHISARIAGRADELYVNFVGVRVKAGDPVYKLYSPDLVTTQEEYLQARAALEELEGKGKPDEAGLARAQKLVASAQERMVLWGLTPAQLAELEKTRKTQTYITIYSPISGTVIEKDIHAGHYVQVGEDPYTIVDDSVLWVAVEVFERDMGLIDLGQAVEITAEAYPGESFSGSVSFIQPSLNPHTRTVKVRVEVPNPEQKLKAGMYVYATMRVPLGKHKEIYYSCCTEEHSSHPGTCTHCQKQLAKHGGLLDDGKAGVYRCPMHPEVVSDRPGKCPKCGMDLVPGEPRESEPARSIWACPMHPERVFDAPGKCPKCGMDLEEHKVEAGSRLIWVCPVHADVTADAPGICPRTGCGKALEFRIVSAPRRLADVWMCDMHPQEEASGSLKCPDCASEMKHMEAEEILSVAFDAVVDTGFRKVVYVERGHGSFDAVEVQLGPRAGEYYPVIHGLAAGDRVVTAGAFLLDAETRLNPAAGAAYFGASGGTGK